MNPTTIKSKGFKNDEVRVGAWISREDYIPIASEFQYGQMNAFWRAVFGAVRKIIQEKRFVEVLLFINGKQDLLLEVNKEN